ncbi:hypothetical protein QAD02_008371 [Eretmocerus hayati]|uniref:Uncharacterized protein n=1 Tax=Eretmocerus hayati TaxID=131215 RepID=A0ACC2N8P4_9HYME|nr:hypothetical protein QAD02_008371 [Eretmocerus hayati]
MKSDCNSEVKNSVCRRVESLPNGNAETQNGKLANINYEICLPQTVPPIEILPNSKPSNDDSDVEYLGISNTIKPVINQSAKCNTKSGTSSNEPEAAANMHCMNDTGITATLTCTGSPGLSAVAPFIRGPSMTANAAYINTAGVSAATPYVQSAGETVEPAYTNAPGVSAAAPCAQDASSTAITQYMQSASETVKPACMYTSGASSATLCVPSASVTAAGYTNIVESQEAEYAYSKCTTTIGRVTYASVDLTPIDSSQRYDNGKILTAHETPIFTNWKQATTALQEKKTSEENLKSHDHAYKNFRNSMKRNLKTALSSIKEKHPGSDPKKKNPPKKYLGRKGRRKRQQN